MILNDSWGIAVEFPTTIKSEAITRHTSLKLLTRDGALAATFTPALTTEQYDELATSVNQFHGKPELRRYLSAVAERWNVSVVIDD
jgi:hypothetical protein